MSHTSHIDELHRVCHRPLSRTVTPHTQVVPSSTGKLSVGGAYRQGNDLCQWWRVDTAADQVDRKNMWLDKVTSSDTIETKLETPSGARGSGTTIAESPVEACVVGIEPAHRNFDDRMGEGVGSGRNVHRDASSYRNLTAPGTAAAQEEKRRSQLRRREFAHRLG